MDKKQCDSLKNVKLAFCLCSLKLLLTFDLKYQVLHYPLQTTYHIHGTQARLVLVEWILNVTCIFHGPLPFRYSMCYRKFEADCFPKNWCSVFFFQNVTKEYFPKKCSLLPVSWMGRRRICDLVKWRCCCHGNC